MEVHRKKVFYFSFDPSDAFGETLIRSVYRRSVFRGLDLSVIDGGILDSPDEWFNKRNILYRWIARQKIDAILLSSIFQFVTPERVMRFLDPFSHIPMVTMSEKIPGLKGVRVDNASGFRELINYLIDDCGSRSFAVITGPDNNVDSIERMEVLVDVMRQKGIGLPANNVYHGSFWPVTGTTGVRELLDARRVKFDTLVCFNDLMANAAMEELKLRGIDIPGEVKVTGFDDNYEAEFLNPSLTTVSYSIEKLGETGVDLVDDILNGKEIPDVTLLKSHPVVRESTGARTGHVYDGVVISESSERAGAGINERLDRICMETLRTAQGFPTASQKEWFAGVYRFIVDHLFSGESFSAAKFCEIVDNAVFASYLNEWSADLWTRTFEALLLLIAEQRTPESALREGMVLSALNLSRTYANRFEVKRLFSREVLVKHMTQMAEDFSTAFDMEMIPRIISRYASFLNIRNCFAVVYTSPTMARARLVARIEDGGILPASEFGDFNPEDLLPGNLAEKYPSLSMEALYVKGEDIGYVLFSVGEHPGIVYKIIRHQIASSIKGAQLMTTVNRYSEGLEMMVEERTQKLRELNESMKREIELRERAEKELLKQKNYESLGLLAGGIAHDFNNFLTAILGNVSILEMDIYDRTAQKKLIRDMMSAIERAKNLTNQLLTFSKGGVPVKKAVSIVPIVEETVLFMLRGSSVRAEFFIAHDLRNSEIDVAQINQVLNNIIINALHAMPDGGVLRVSMDSVRMELDEADLPRGEYNRIIIEDTGCGIPHENIDRIFDPYFTTKEKGSGLGLSTSLGIIRKHGGTIRASSVEGKGTAFSIYIPLTESEDEGSVISSEVRLPDNMNILILEDNEQVISVLTLFVESIHARADITVEGIDTIRRYREEFDAGKKYDIVLTDLTIPGGMGGAEVMREILAFDPSACGIVSSGYSEVPVMADYRKHGFVAMLKKPFTFEEFKKALFEALDDKRKTGRS
ncbi:MAG TPA: substrate-binding domain-containing protein [Spirochaetota bacterium]|nr:substrate-binding domain-containing protein [Spirochaetota bacterium]